MEAADMLKSAHLKAQMSYLQSASIDVKALVVDVVEAVAIEEAAGGLLQTLAELTWLLQTPSFEL
jgi:hypothetical protein